MSSGVHSSCKQPRCAAFNSARARFARGNDFPNARRDIAALLDGVAASNRKAYFGRLRHRTVLKYRLSVKHARTDRASRALTRSTRLLSLRRPCASYLSRHGIALGVEIDIQRGQVHARRRAGGRERDYGHR